TAEPPSIRSREPNGVVTASKAIEPTTVVGIGRARVAIASVCVRAIQITEFGGPEVLQLVDLPRPKPSDREVLIEVRRAGLNFADTHQRTNSYVAKAELPLVPGS